MLAALVTAVMRLADAGPDRPEAAAAPVPAVAALTPAQSLERTLAGADGRLSVAVADLQTGVIASYGSPEAEFATASVVKVNILAALLLQRDGKLSERQRDLARQMIQSSSNGAASALWREIGRAEGLKRANQQLGLTDTVGGRAGFWGSTTTSAADQLQLLGVIFTDDSPLDPNSRAYLRTLMGRVAPDQDWGVTAADTRTGDRFRVKNGWLPRSSGWVLNSIGAVEYRGHPLLMVALSDGAGSKDGGVRVLESVARDAARVVTGA